MLLFLTEISDPFQALDGAGAPLPLATLQFYVSGTTAQAPVYSDVALETEISQPIAADSAGEFPTIYLDPAVAYRSVLKRADGALVWDIDPYEIDSSAGGRNLFRTPRVQALDDDGLPIPGATMTFYTTATSTKRDIFADAELETPLPNPISADAGGFFPPIYLSGTYKVDPSWSAEIDPYPPEAELFTVTIGENGLMDGYGYDEGSYGDIDPDPYEVDGNPVVGVVWRLDFFFLLFDDFPSPDLPGDLRVQSVDPDVYVTLLADDATLVEGGYRWADENIAWDNSIIAEERTVEFV